MPTAPEIWYSAVPGVPETGPANIHFIRDIGLAFLAAGRTRAMRVRGWRRKDGRCRRSLAPPSPPVGEGVAEGDG